MRPSEFRNLKVSDKRQTRQGLPFAFVAEFSKVKVLNSWGATHTLMARKCTVLLHDGFAYKNWKNYFRLTELARNNRIKIATNELRRT